MGQPRRRVAAPFVAFLLRALGAAGVTELVDPSLVVSAYMDTNPMARMRGVRVGDGVHVDVYDPESGLAVDADEAMLELIAGIAEERLEEKGGAVAAPPWKAVTGFPAVQCQVDDILSIATELRSGRFLLNLFEQLYQQRPAADWAWTRRGLDFGAGVDPTGDDPMRSWAGAFGETVVLVDMSAERLARAGREIRAVAARAGKEAAPELVEVATTITPQGVAGGALGDTIRAATGGSVDVVKVDIDSFDCDVLRALLGGLEAAVLVLEVQPAAPPPIRFARLFHPEDPLTHGWVGCSVSYQAELLRPAYQLILNSEDSAVFVRSSLLPVLEALPAGSIFYWTRFKPRLPADEWDCFRRTRTLDQTRLAARASQGHVTPPAFVREWAFELRPIDARSRIWGNITELAFSHELAAGEKPPLYVVDV